MPDDELPLNDPKLLPPIDDILLVVIIIEPPPEPLFIDISDGRPRPSFFLLNARVHKFCFVLFFF